MAVAQGAEAIDERLRSLLERTTVLESEGLPFPTAKVRETVEMAIAEGDVDRAAKILKQAESAYTKASRDWMWVRELLTRADELKAIAERVGMDIAPMEARVGRPRDQLKDSNLSEGALERAAASASLALAILNDALPKYCVQEAQKLGASIRQARDRGEDVTQATAEFRRLLRALQEEQLPITAQRLVESRKAVARIPPAPSAGPLPTSEEEEILVEARNLARRLHRIKGKAKNAQSAARLVTQVRAALSEDRRFGTPEEEIETLWQEVDRLTKERNQAGAPRSLASDVDAPDGAVDDDPARPNVEGAGGADPPLAHGPPGALPGPGRAASSARVARPRVPTAVGIVPHAPNPIGDDPPPSSRRRRREPVATPPPPEPATAGDSEEPRSSPGS